MSKLDKEKYHHLITTVNNAIYFDENNYLRETASNIDLLIHTIDELEKLVLSANESEKYLLSGMLGNLYRIYGNDEPLQLMKAEQYLNFCLDYAKRYGDITKETITLVRLGEVYKYKNHHQAALVLFEQALAICGKQGLELYLDFIYQHMGKCYLEMKLYDLAEAHFTEALNLRKQKGDASLFESTLKAIQLNLTLRYQ